MAHRGWKHSGIARESKCACHKITGLIGALSGIAVGKTVCPTGMDGKLKNNNLELYCIKVTACINQRKYTYLFL